MESLWSSVVGYYGALILFFLAVAVVALPPIEEPSNNQEPKASKKPKLILSAALIMLSGLLLTNTGLLKEDKVRQARYRQFCLDAIVDIRSVAPEKGGISEDERGLLAFAKGQGPRYTNFDCSIRAGWFPFLVRPANDRELIASSEPFRKISYFPVGDGEGRCADPKQRQIAEPISVNNARYSITRNSNPLLSNDDIKLGIKGDIVEIRDNSAGHILALLKYFYIRQEFKVCPNHAGNLPADSIVLGVLRGHPNFERIMDQWRH